MTLALSHPPPDRDDIALRWFDELYRDVDAGWISLFSVERTGPAHGTRHVDWAPVGGLDVLAATAIDRAATCCVWFGVATRKANLGLARGGSADCHQLPALWVDIDVAGPNHADSTNLPATLDDAWRLVRAFPAPATAVVNTGGGLQAWWFLAEPVDIDTGTETLLARWHATWMRQAGPHHIDNVFDVARIMRLPGTQNRKHAAVDVDIIEVDYQRRYGVDDLEQWLDEPAPPPVPAARAGVPYIGPERPGDAYSARHTGGDVLGALGFTLARRDSNGDEHWTRPGKTTREGTSATVYGEDGHTTIWSDTCAHQWPKLQLRRPYDPFGLLVATRYDGDWSAAYSELLATGYGHAPEHIEPRNLIEGGGAPAKTEDSTDDEDEWNGPVPIDWVEFWGRERSDIQWACYPILPRGRQAAMWAIHKTGKSLLTLEIAAACATGQVVLGNPAQPALSVVYLDLEMTEDDLEERLIDLDYSPESVLDNLHYYLLPSLPPLDSYPGGAALAAIVDRHQADLVVIDTISRVISGDENDADTFRNFYKCTGLALKQRGVSLLRLDHGGKDPTKGQRGSSAKGDDVDIVWKLEPADTGLMLRRERARMSWIPDKVNLVRHTGPLRHVIEGGQGYLPGTAKLVEKIRSMGLAGSSANAIQKALRAAGEGVGRNAVLDAARSMRAPSPDPKDLIG